MLSALSLVTKGFLVPTIVQTKNVVIGGVKVAQKALGVKASQKTEKVKVKGSSEVVRVKTSRVSVKARVKKPTITIHN